SVFETAGGAPVQRPTAPPAGTPVVDLRGLPESSRRFESRRLARAEARRPFDLSAGPMLRTLLLVREAEEHELVFVLHHIAADGWSVALLVREVAELYRRARDGGAGALEGDAGAGPPIQYG